MPSSTAIIMESIAAETSTSISVKPLFVFIDLVMLCKY
jgi:hypothetical protein